MADIGSYTYLLHFEKPFGKKMSAEKRAAFGLPERKSEEYTPTARHYVGSTDDLARRIEEHRQGRSGAASFTRAAKRAGVRFIVARVLRGGTDTEYAIKRQKNTPHWCPICNAKVQMTEIDMTPEEIENELVAF